MEAMTDMPRFPLVLLIACLSMAACDSPNTAPAPSSTQAPLHKGNAIESIRNKDGVFWYDSVTAGDAHYFNFRTLRKGVGNKGATEPIDHFGGRIENCSTDTVICTTLGALISFPSQAGVKKWQIDQFSCDLQAFDNAGQVTCRDTIGNDDMGVIGFAFQFEDQCITGYQSLYRWGTPAISQYAARDKRICFDLGYNLNSE